MFSATKGGSPSGYQISRSVRLRSSASAYLDRTMTSSFTSQRIFTFSFWLKRGTLSTAQSIFDRNQSTNVNQFTFGFNTNNTFAIVARTSGTSTISLNLTTSAVFRDPSAWYHFFIAIDNTQATLANRGQIYVNGVLQTLGTQTVTQNVDYRLLTGLTYDIGRTALTASQYFDGYLTEFNFIDGQQLTPASFGETNSVTGVWQPKKYTGTYGNNGFYLNFSDNSAATAAAIGKDYSGNGNNWTPNNISLTAGVTYDSMLDVPTQWADGGNGRGNYATWNPLDKNANGSIAGGNLNNTNGSANNAGVRSTFALPQSGKWYAELVVNASTSGSSALGFGFATASADMGGSVDGANKYDIYGSSTGSIFSNTTSLTGSIGAFTAGDILQVAYDGATGKAWVGKNNTWYNSSGGSTGDPANGTNQTFTLSGEFFLYSYYYNTNASLNCGQRPFAYTPPTGFKALNTLNLPTPTILKGNQYFDATTYTGNGSTQSITNAGGMQPDLVWIKMRSGAFFHNLYDSVRGVNKMLASNATDAEVTYTDRLMSFDSSGFSLGTGSGVNQSSSTFVGWQWKEGATQGFDIVTYTGNGANRTIAHNLGVAPKMIIVKNRTTATGGGNWPVYHASQNASPASGATFLNLTNAFAAASQIWNSTAPTSSVFSVGTSAETNFNTATYVAYLFAAVAGFSAFGSYTGNGSADGPFVFCGFRPRWIMVKRTDATEDWIIYDSARDVYNPEQLYLYPNSSAAEAGSGTPRIDFVANGFKCRNSGQNNVSAGTYIYAAFAENPFKNALAR